MYALLCYNSFKVGRVFSLGPSILNTFLNHSYLTVAAQLLYVIVYVIILFT